MESVDAAPVDLAAIERARLRAIVDADGPALWAMHDPEFVLCSPGGGIWDRDRYVRDAEAGWRCRWSQATDTIKD